MWALQVGGFLPGAYLQGPAWHAHEMLFGYTLAVITGFLFTAVRNWTACETPTGGLLAGYAAFWIAGRALVLTPFADAAALVNAMFPVAVAIGIGVPLVQSGNKRNYFFVGLLAAFALAACTFYASLAGLIARPPRASLQVGLDIVLFVIAVIGGRVIPMFTNNGVPGAGATRNVWVERAALGSVLAVLAGDVLNVPAMGWLASIAAIAHATRLALWRPWRTGGNALVWILHAAYGWIVAHFALRALAAAGVVPESAAIHALTVGAIGGMTLGMMTRTALGHGGRMLRAGRAETWAYVLVMAAALARVYGAVGPASNYVAMIIASALLWSSAFAIYVVAYWPILTRPRADGKPG